MFFSRFLIIIMTIVIIIIIIRYQFLKMTLVYLNMADKFTLTLSRVAVKNGCKWMTVNTRNINPQKYCPL